MRENKVLSHVFSNFRHMAEVLLHRSVVISILPSIIGALKVVVPGCAVTIPIRFTAMIDHLLHPLLFGLMSAVKAVYSVLAHKINAFSYVLTLTVQHICQVEREERLVSAHDE